MILNKILRILLDRFTNTKDDIKSLSGYSYFAFISYTQKDEKWAKWLQWEIEHYKIPTKVRCDYHELPTRIRPIFWYKNDLAGAHLSGSIKKELEQSKYLIVICSPASANKVWVNDEVAYFKDELKRGDRIIPFVVAGKIKSTNEDQECIPLPIRNLPPEKELRCIDVREYGKNKALVNIVSTLLDIRFDILWNRFNREQKKRMAIFSTITIICFTALLGCWDYFLHTRYKYYVDMEDCNGMPTGIIQISNKEAKNHYRLYRFEYRRRSLQRVMYVDRYGNPQNHTNTELLDRPCIQELSYDDEMLSEIECKDATFKTLYIMHFSKTNNLAVDLKDEDDNQAANFIYSSTSVDRGEINMQQISFLDRFMVSPSKIARYIYERDSDGYITKKIYARHNGEDDDISMDVNGISGFEYERDSLHRVIRIRFLDKNHEYKSNHIGIAGKRYKYDQFGNLAVAEYVDLDGQLKYNEYHWARSIDKYDSNGYCKEEYVFGPDGAPCISSVGYHKMKVTYQENNETFSYYDIHHKPTYLLSIGGTPGGFSIKTNVYNSKGQIVEIQFKDSNSNLCYNHSHVAVMKFEYNDMGLIVDARNYGTDHEPCANVYGYFYERTIYNKKGYITENSVYNTDEMPVQNGLGIHKMTMQYDNSEKRLTEVHVYNQENIPFNCLLLNGASWVKLDYQGSSRWVSELSFYGIDNKPAETNIGSRIRCERDPNGLIIAYKYYNSDYQLSSSSNHPAIKKMVHNDQGWITNYTFYDENKKPILFNGTYAVHNSYTETGLLEKICNYDTLYHLKNNSEGWAIKEMNYRNNVISAYAFYGEAEERIEVNGVHKYVCDIDDSGYILSNSAYNKELQPTVLPQTGVHKVVNMYDDLKRNIGCDYYDSMNKVPFVSIRSKFNERGLKIEQATYNGKKELIESPMNFEVAKVEWKYDSHNRLMYIGTTNSKGKKMNSSYGFAEAYFSYDNNIYEGVYLDSKGKLVNNITVAEPCAYSITYLTDTGRCLFCKSLKVLYDNETEEVRYAIRYDSQHQQPLQFIRCDDLSIKVYDISKKQEKNYSVLDDEYDAFIHIVDSIQLHVESTFRAPKLYKYVKVKKKTN